MPTVKKIPVRSFRTFFHHIPDQQITSTVASVLTVDKGKIKFPENPPFRFEFKNTVKAIKQ